MRSEAQESGDSQGRRERDERGAPALSLLQTGPSSQSGLRQVVHEPVAPVDEVHLPHNVPHLEPGERLRDEVLAPERHLRVLVAPVGEAADNSG